MSRSGKRHSSVRVVRACALNGSVKASAAEGSSRLSARIAGLALARFVGQGASGVALVLLARWTGPEDFGTFSVVWAVLLTVSGVLTFGLPVFALRCAVLGRGPATEYAIHLNRVTSAFGAGVGASVALLSTNASVAAVMILAGSVALEKNSLVLVGLGTEFGQQRRVNVIVSVRGIAAILLFVILHWVGLEAVVSFALGRAIAMGLSMAALVVSVRGWPASRRRPRDQSLESLGSIAIASSIEAVRGLDVMFVGVLAGSSVVGLYSAVQKMAIPVGIFASSMCTVVLGKVACASRSETERLTRWLKRFAVVTILAAALLGRWSEEIVVLIFGSEFQAASGAFAWTLVALPALALVPIAVTILQARGAARRVLTSSAVVVLVQLVLIPVGGLIGGATTASMVLAITAWARFVWLLRDVRAHSADG